MQQDPNPSTSSAHRGETSMMSILIRDKYNGDTSRQEEINEDMERLAAGEPLAYVIGWIPFLGLKIFLEAGETRALIPRPETEWWTEKLITHLQERFGNFDEHRGLTSMNIEQPFRLLDLCAGSGAIGLAVLSKFPNAQISFGDIKPELADLIQKNISANNLDAGRVKNLGTSRIEIKTGDLFAPFENQHFDIIATNPPYIPSERTLEASVTSHEPYEALFAGADGLDSIRRIIDDAPSHLAEGGELWMECDISNIVAAERLASLKFTETNIYPDQYGRSRLLVSELA
jgi:release factor glutamine methyltransferase